MPQNTRRAHSAKYIIDRSNLTGSRSLFVSPTGKQCLNSSKAVSAYLNAQHRDRNQDAVLLIFLNEQNNVLHLEALHTDALLVASNYIPVVTREAKETKASSDILVQCSPTRSAKPYSRDHEVSKNLQAALETMEVSFLDHIIMGRNECFSFADNQLL